jgi:phospholipid transport system substrate-binding protein
LLVGGASIVCALFKESGSIMTAATRGLLDSRIIAWAFAAILAFAGFSGGAIAACPGEKLVKSAAASFAAAKRANSAAAYSAAISRYADVNTLALYALGPYRKNLPDSRRAEYITQTRAYMGRFIKKHANSIVQTNLQVVSCSGDIVKTTNGEREISWRVSNGRIRDVGSGGVWLVVQMRSKFVSIIRRGGGDIQAIFDMID